MSAEGGGGSDGSSWGGGGAWRAGMEQRRETQSQPGGLGKSWPGR